MLAAKVGGAVALIALGTGVLFFALRKDAVATVAVVDAVGGLSGDVPAKITLSPGGASSTVSPPGSAFFSKLPPSATFHVNVGAPYLAGPAELRLDDHGNGAATVRLIQLRDVPQDAAGTEPVKRLHVELNGTQDPVVRWVAGEVLFYVRTVALAKLQEEIDSSWRNYGLHSKASDASTDEALLLVSEGTKLENVEEAARALIGVVRDRDSAGKKESVPAFRITVARPKSATRAPLPPEPDLAAADKVKPEQVRWGATTVNGRMARETILSTVQEKNQSFAACYGKALDGNPNLQGRVAIRFVINVDGTIANVVNGGSDLPDPQVMECMIGLYRRMSFPKPEGGIVTVLVPTFFSPGSATTGQSAKVSATTPPVAAPKNKPCGCDAADLMCNMRCAQKKKSASPKATETTQPPPPKPQPPKPKGGSDPYAD
jgi:hypothetical protein